LPQAGALPVLPQAVAAEPVLPQAVAAEPVLPQAGALTVAPPVAAGLVLQRAGPQPVLSQAALTVAQPVRLVALQPAEQAVLRPGLVLRAVPKAASPQALAFPESSSCRRQAAPGQRQPRTARVPKSVRELQGLEPRFRLAAGA
jgi:hypothetical protein